MASAPAVSANFAILTFSSITPDKLRCEASKNSLKNYCYLLLKEKMSQFSHFYFTPVYCKNYHTINLIYIKSVNPRLLG